MKNLYTHTCTPVYQILYYLFLELVEDRRLSIIQILNVG